MTVDPGAILRAVIDHSDHEHKAVAYELEYMGDYWSRVLTSERGVLLAKLGRMPLDIQRAFLTAWAQAIGLPLGHDAEVHALVDLIATRKVRISVEAMR